MNELKSYIRTYFETTEESTLQLEDYFSMERLTRNQFHTQAGSRIGKLSFVKSGFLRVFKQTDKTEITQWVSSPGEFTADINAMIFQQPARVSIQALTECELYTLSPEDYRRIQQEIPEWPQIEKRFIGKCFMTMEDRIMSFISMTTEERYHYFYHHNTTLFQQVPQQYIASILGMTPETFSRIRAKSIS